MRIVGVGFDDPSETGPWAKSQKFPFEIWTDTDKTLALTYGAAASTSASTPARRTVILDAEGDWILEYDDVVVSTSPGLVLADCQALFGD